MKLKNYQLFLLYFTISAVVYYATKGAGMVFDFNGWTTHYQNGTYADVLNSFGYDGLHQMEQFAFFSLYKLLHFNHFGWYIVFAFLHALSAFVSYLSIRTILDGLVYKKAQQIALFASFLFLISPLASDTVVSKVTVHYFTSFLFMMGAFYFEVKYFQLRKIKYLVFIVLLYILALFSLEISYIFPVMFALLWCALLYANEKLHLKEIIKSPIVLPFVLLAGFLLLHKLVLGNFIGHYGAEVHAVVDIPDIFSNVLRYFASNILLFDYWYYPLKEFVSVYSKQFAYFLIIIILALIGFIFYKLNAKQLKFFVVLLFFLAMALFALAPISNLYYAYMLPLENDRYGYFASIFMFVALAVLYYELPKNKFKNYLLYGYLAFNIYFLVQNVVVLHKSSVLTWNLLNDFKWFDEEVLILNDLENFSGAKVFSAYTEVTSFSESLALHTGINRKENIHLAYQMNFNELTDSVWVSHIDSNHYKVEMAQWGNWFWRNGFGATSYENEQIKVVLNNEYRIYYDLYLKEPAKDYTLIYVAGDTWREVKQ